MLDDLSTGSLANVAGFRDHERFHCVTDTVTNDAAIGPLVGGGMAMYLPLKSVIFLGGFILLPLVIFLWYMRPKNEENSHGSPAQLR